VALLGWTNVGKSTLLNRLVGDKIAAVADVAQTTRRRITGVLNLQGRGQIAFVDTPGLHRPRNAMNRAMVEAARGAIHDVDLVALMVDASRGLGDGDCKTARMLADAGVQRVLVLNKIDCVRPKAGLLPMMHTAVEQWGLAEALPVSALTGAGCEELIEAFLKHMPEDRPHYPDDFLTDQSERAIAAELVREKLLHLTHMELPHATAVLVEGWDERDDGLVEITATILVDRESQKRIVIGRQGGLLKQAGSEARVELEHLLGRRVYLQLWVKVRKDWRDDERTLRELGLHG
jgi:GTP-binding protein Era